MILDERVLEALAAGTRFRDVRLFDEVDSTNRVVATLAAKGAPDGLVVAADYQNAGRGRLDRSWEAAPGTGLLASVLLRPRDLPAARWHLLTAAAGLAAQAACREVAGAEPEIKWPNDLLLGGRKLAGILAEVQPANHTEGAKQAAPGSVVIGLGVNVHGGPPGSAVLDRAVGRRIRREELLVSWLTSLDGLLGRWADLADSYRQKCSTVGRAVVVEQVDGTRVEGIAHAVDDQGRLVVIVAGHEVVVSAGDVTHLRSSPGVPLDPWSRP